MKKKLSSVSLACFISLIYPVNIAVASPESLEVVEDVRTTAGAIYQEGLQLYQQGTAESLQQAIARWQESLKLWQEVGDKSQQALMLNNIGIAYNNLGEKQEALNHYKQALSLRREVGDRRGEATTLNNMGSVYDSLGAKQEALNYYNQALLLRRQVGDKRGEATTLSNIGSVYDSLGEKQKALNYYKQALALDRAVGNRKGEAITLSNIGAVHDSLGEKQEALNYYNQALPIRRQVGDKRGEAVTLNNIGHVYDSLGEKEEALNYYNQALPIRRQVGDRDGEARTLNNMGSVYDDLGAREEALNYYKQALILHRQVGNPSGEATALNNMGSVYDNLGEREEALNYYQQALLLHREVGDKREEATTLNNIGFVYDNLGKKEEALNHYNQALSLSRTVGDHKGEAITLNNIGAVYNGLGKREEALNYYNQALPLTRAVGNRGGEAATLNNIGLVYNGLGQKEEALNYYNQALPLTRAVGDRSGEANTLNNIARLQYQQGNLIAASQTMAQAIEKIEFLRNKILNPQLQTSFYQTIEDYYDFHIKLLMELYKQNPSQQHHTQALHYSERVRARQLLTKLQEASVDIKQGVDPKLLAQEEQLNKQLSIALENQTKLLQSSYSNQEAANLQQQIRKLLTQLDEVETTIRLRSPNYAAINQPTKFTLQTTEIQQLLDHDTILLEYYLSEGQSYLWVVSKNKVTTYQLPPQGEIEKLAAQFRDDIANETENNPEVAQQLSQMILAPASQELGNKRLLIVGDGLLQSIPFAVLPTPNIPNSPQKPLIIKHEIITLPSASSLAALRQNVQGRNLAPKKLAVLADPVYEVEEEGGNLLRNLTREAQEACRSLQNLPYTRTEAENILALVPENESFAALGHEASLTTALSPQLSQYQTVHFATHGCLNQDVPQFSGLALSAYSSQGETQDNILRLNSIYNLVLPAELVVLSACETGLGEELAGEGLVSLTRGFMYAGAKRVVVSFWAVNDSSTSELMSKFYEKMYQDKLRPGAALRAAQLEMWQKGGDWQDPYHWAAFTVQGEW